MKQGMALAVLGLSLMLAGCNGNREPASNEDLKRGMDQLVQASKDQTSQLRDIASSDKTTADTVKLLTTRVESMERNLSVALSQQKRGALYLSLDVDASCDNDEQCMNTARGLCNKINYPNAITSKFTPGIRPTLHSLVCFD